MARNTITRAVLREDLPKVLQAFLDKIKSTFQTLGNLVTAWGSTPSDTKYPSEKLVKTALDGKVDKETGKGLSTNDFTDAYKSSVDSNTSARHAHVNKSVLDGISSTDVANWNAAEPNVQSDWNQTTSTADDYIKNRPQNLVQDASYVHTDNNYTTADKNKVDSAVQPGDLGTAAYKDVPASGNASNSQVVMGDDSRLSDARPASDVPAWAKAATKPTYTASEVGAAASSHPHGSIANDGKSTSEPTSTDKFLRADGSWQVPPKSLQYWSGGSNSIKGVYIGTCNMQSGWNAWITGTMSLTNYHNSNPNTSGGKGIALGLFYLWAFRSGGSISAYCRLYSLNARHTNTDLMLVYKKDTSDATTYKVHFYVCFGPGNSGGGTATNQRPFGLGINYLENHNADIPKSLTGITSDIQYDGYYSVFKMPYLSQGAANVGSSTKSVYVNVDGNIVEGFSVINQPGSQQVDFSNSTQPVSGYGIVMHTSIKPTMKQNGGIARDWSLDVCSSMPSTTDDKTIYFV